jgi:hypothetical protein
MTGVRSPGTVDRSSEGAGATSNVYTGAASNVHAQAAGGRPGFCVGGLMVSRVAGRRIGF